MHILTSSIFGANMTTQSEIAFHLIEMAVEKSRPTRQRRQRLSAKEAIQEACRADQRLSGNWGYWIRSLEKEVEAAINKDVNSRASMRARSHQKNFTF